MLATLAKLLAKIQQKIQQLPAVPGNFLLEHDDCIRYENGVPRKPDADEEEPREPSRPFVVPIFTPVIPEELADDWREMSKAQRVLVKQLSIQGQQNAWIMQRLLDGHMKMEWYEEQLRLLMQLKTKVLAKWSVVAVIVSVLLVPIGLAILTAWITKLMKGP